MHEILFRGKRIDNGEWIEGVPYGEYMICGIETMRCDDEVPESEYLEFDYFEIDPSTVGQYTSLKDKHGKMIFEGDVVVGIRFTNKETGIIRHNEKMACYEFMVKHVDGHINSCLIGHCNSIEVTGNVFDNPELLEV